MVSAVYHVTDGGFTSHMIRAAARVEFHCTDPNPQRNDTVAAIELGLVGDRWEHHLAEIRTINRENQPRTGSAWRSGRGCRQRPLADS